jgi:hypothetical protein
VPAQDLDLPGQATGGFQGETDTQRLTRDQRAGNPADNRLADNDVILAHLLDGGRHDRGVLDARLQRLQFQLDAIGVGCAQKLPRFIHRVLAREGSRQLGHPLTHLRINRLIAPPD